jgi:hypothetical protein
MRRGEPSSRPGLSPPGPSCRRRPATRRRIGPELNWPVVMGHWVRLIALGGAHPGTRGQPAPPIADPNPWEDLTGLVTNLRGTASSGAMALPPPVPVPTFAR